MPLMPSLLGLGRSYIIINLVHISVYVYHVSYFCWTLERVTNVVGGHQIFKVLKLFHFSTDRN